MIRSYKTLFGLFLGFLWLMLCRAELYSHEPEMVFVKGDWYEMGCGNWTSDCDNNENPVHRVYVDDFYMGRYEVTLGEFRKFIKDTGYRTQAEKGGGLYIYIDLEVECEKKKGTYWDNPDFPQKENHPVVGVSWNDAREYCRWLSKKTGRHYRLPTEAEWEYAARNCGMKIKYPWGNNEPDGSRCNFADRSTGFVWSDRKADDGYEFTSPVGMYLPNELGLYDMAGNVWEWCQDWYDENYYKKTEGFRNPVNCKIARFRVGRGGSWLSGVSVCRSADRFGKAPDAGYYYLGFRLARTP
ncbi:MAG: formylglycine-generating enzyme family protein [Thermodesulfobacteriota bacterium]|nr:formylglycine-generating enzyme family protein [Thermodesulfobacteriota bacterium]